LNILTILLDEQLHAIWIKVYETSDAEKVLADQLTRAA
jgi:hypothetical protein